MVSTALRVTGTASGSGTIQGEKYNVDEEDVDEFDGSEDGGEYRCKNGTTCKMSMRKMSTSKIWCI